MNLDADAKMYLAGALQALYTSGNMAAVRQHQDERDRQLYVMAFRDALIGLSITLAVDVDLGESAFTLPAASLSLPAKHDELTPRELEVSRLIVEGLSTSQIAARLVVEPATVKTHRRGISRKMGTSSRAGLTAKRETWDQT